MPKHLLVDGFNVIRRDPQLSQIEQKNFYGAQEILLERLSVYRSGTAHQVTLVFDASHGQNRFRQRSFRKGIEIIFSARGETADEVIQERVATPSQPVSGIVVVTADRALGDFCKAHRAQVIPPEILLQRSHPQTRLFPKNQDAYFGKREEKSWVGHTHKSGNARRRPKAKRRSRVLW